MKKNFLIAGVMAGIMGVAVPATSFATTMVPSFELPEGNGDETVSVEAPAPEGGESPGNVSAGSGDETGAPALEAGSGTGEGAFAPPVTETVGGAGDGETSAPPVVEAGGGTQNGGGSGGSQVIESGRGGSGQSGFGQGGPGMVGPGPIANRDPSEQPSIPEQNSSSVVPGRLDYFSEPVANPVVEVVEKYTYDMMVEDLNELQSRHGQRMKINVIGTSLDGRNLYEVILGNPDAPKHVLIHAGIHAREYMMPLLVMKQLEYGLEFYDHGSYEGQFISDILQQVAVHFVPMVNPDGILISQYGVDALQSEDLKQAVRQCYADDLAEGRTSSAFERYLIYWKANARGVNLNGNFPANWDIVATTPKPSYASYKGESALSEPETQALANLANSRTWAATVSYHSMGNIIYWDYDGNRVRQESSDLTNQIAASTGYRPAGSSGHGGFKDWMQIKENPAASVTIETGGVSCPLPLSEYPDVWERNKMVWILTAKYAMEH